MDTTAAATEAQVTAATIRTWCRNGVITAAKAAGRWDITAASLAHRIAIGAMHARKDVVSKPREYTPEELKAFTLDQKRMIRSAAKAEADIVRSRVRAAIELPALTGSDKQIEWAESLRADQIHRATEYIAGTRFGAVSLSLIGAGSDPLYLLDLGAVPDAGRYATEADLLAALHKALTTTDGTYFTGHTGDRTAAAWWIDHR